ncbi:MAG: HDOD domain-containing protein [Planctomycetota bacterium]
MTVSSQIQSPSVSQSFSVSRSSSVSQSPRGSEPASQPGNIAFEVPRFSATASQLVDELNGASPTVPIVVQLIECEPTISSLILRLANSPIYGATRAITSIAHAIVVLGFRSVAQQAIATATGALFTDPHAPCFDARQQTYIESLGVAAAARFIARATNACSPDEAFLCGVIHDVGKLILLQHAGDEYAALLAGHPQGVPLEKEIELFGISHADLGRECCVVWSLPTQLGNAVAEHHGLISEVTDPLSRTLILATYLARKWQLGFIENSLVENEVLETELSAFQNDAMFNQCREQFKMIREICLEA